MHIYVGYVGSPIAHTHNVASGKKRKKKQKKKKKLFIYKVYTRFLTSRLLSFSIFAGIFAPPFSSQPFSCTLGELHTIEMRYSILYNIYAMNAKYFAGVAGVAAGWSRAHGRHGDGVWHIKNLYMQLQI